MNLSGKQYNINLNLSGYNFAKSIDNTDHFKIVFMDSLFIPLLAKDWKTLKENIIFTNKIKNSISQENQDLLKVIEHVLNEHEQLAELEKIMYGSLDDFNYLYKTTVLKLRPEYELYDMILGKPIFPVEKYNESILTDILKLLEIKNINFKKTKEYIIQKYAGRNN